VVKQIPIITWALQNLYQLCHRPAYARTHLVSFVRMFYPVTSHLLCCFHLNGSSSQNFSMPLAYLVSKPQQKLITCLTHRDQTSWIFFWTSGSQLIRLAALQSEREWISSTFPTACARTVSVAMHCITLLSIILLHKYGNSCKPVAQSYTEIVEKSS
jgi:hypothetical protein